MEEGVGWLYKQLKETYPWSIEQVFLGATDKTDGRVNMEIIKSQPNWQTNYPAFAAVDALNAEGVTGWYLPAVDEANTIKYKSKQHIWTSTEINDQGAYSAYYQWGSQVEDTKQSRYTVYAVHRFEY